LDDAETDLEGVPLSAFLDSFDLDLLPPNAAVALAVLRLGPENCRFLLGDPRGNADFGFCCEPAEKGLAYCGRHRAVCFVAA
jgi:hypothetical protein